MVPTDPCALRSENHESNVEVLVCFFAGGSTQWMSRSTATGQMCSPSIPVSSSASCSALREGWHSIGVTAGLNPDLQFGVKKDEGALEIGVHDQGRAGEVTWPFRPLEWLRAGIDQFPHSAAFDGQLGCSHRPPRTSRRTQGRRQDAARGHRRSVARARRERTGDLRSGP